MNKSLRFLLALMLTASAAALSAGETKTLEDSLLPWERILVAALSGNEGVRTRYEAMKGQPADTKNAEEWPSAQDKDKELLAVWRGALIRAAEGYSGGKDAAAFTDFETRFLQAYVAANAPAGDGNFSAMSLEASLREAREKPETKAQAEEAVKNIRSLLKAEFAAYAKDGRTPEASPLASWAQQAFRRAEGEDKLDLAKADQIAKGLVARLETAPDREKPKEEAPKRDALQEAIAARFSSPVARAMLEFIARKQGAEAWTRKLLALDPEKDQDKISGLNSLIEASVADYLLNDGNPKDPDLAGVGSAFVAAGLDNSKLLDYYCDKNYNPGSSAPEPSTAKVSPRAQAEKVKENTLWAAGSATDADAKSGAEFVSVTRPQMWGRCTEHVNAKKRQAAIDESAPRQPVNNIAGDIPTPIGADKDPEKPPEGPKIPWRPIAIGGAAGAVAFGILGFLLGGPVGLLIGAAAGVAIMGTVTAVNHKVI